MKLRLTIEVEYESNGVSDVALKDMLDHIPSHAAGTGQFTLDTPAEVSDWTHKIEIVQDENTFQFSDGSYLEYPDDDGSIRRRDKDGNCEDVRRPGDDDWDEWAQIFGPFLRDQFDDGECPDCGEPIPYNIGHGDECPNCGHVFHDEKEIAEQLRLGKRDIGVVSEHLTPICPNCKSTLVTWTSVDDGDAHCNGCGNDWNVED